MGAPKGNQYAKGCKTSGRPRKHLDVSLIKKLAEMQCTDTEIASALECSRKSLHNHEEYFTVIKEARERGKISLRRLQFKLAEKSAAMAIWLGKQYLGQKEPEDIVKETAKAGFNVYLENNGIKS